MDDERIVLAAYPRAYLLRFRGQFQIVRPKTEDDRQDGINYVALSALHSESSIAWWYAARKVREEWAEKEGVKP